MFDIEYCNSYLLLVTVDMMTMVSGTKYMMKLVTTEVAVITADWVEWSMWDMSMIRVNLQLNKFYGYFSRIWKIRIFPFWKVSLHLHMFLWIFPLVFIRKILKILGFAFRYFSFAIAPSRRKSFYLIIAFRIAGTDVMR